MKSISKIIATAVFFTLTSSVVAGPDSDERRVRNPVYSKERAVNNGPGVSFFHISLDKGKPALVFSKGVKRSRFLRSLWNGIR